MNEESGDIKMGLCCLGIKAAIVSNSPIQSTFLERMCIFGCDVKVVLIIVRQEHQFLKRTCCSISSTLSGSAGRERTV